MRNQDLLADGILQSRTLLHRYLRGFDDSNLTAQAPGLPNHVAWTLGHLALTLHRVADRLDGGGVPAWEFSEGGVRAPERFSRESVAFGSRPSASAGDYPCAARCRAIFDAACDRLATGLRGCDDAKLESLTPWGDSQTTIRDLCVRMVFHNGTHCGQIADLRRALGMGSIFA
jgi:hypothetical protein